MKCITDFAEFYTNERGWTDAFKQAISALEQCGGGLLNVPAGNYETFPIELKSHITLSLEAGAKLLFIQDYKGFPVIKSEFEGRFTDLYMPCIYAKNAEDVTVCGQGSIDGQGSYWWENRKQLPCQRPYLICFENCKRVKILDVKLQNSPVWTVHPLYCEDVEVRGITIRNPYDSPNTDGINPDSSKNVRIADCLIDVGDDCVTLKSGTEETPTKQACENITITNCNMVHGHGGVVIGSEMSGDVRNVVISNCVFQNTDRGVRLKTRRGRGGNVESILISNVIMDNVVCPFVFNMYYRCGNTLPEYSDKKALPVTEATPSLKNVQIQNCIVTDAQAAAGYFEGLPESPIKNVTISDCFIKMKKDALPEEPAMTFDREKMAQSDFIMRNTDNVVFRNVHVENVTDNHS